MSHKIEKPYTARFIGAEEKVLLELTNTTGGVLKSVGILSICLKDQGKPGGVPSRSHMKFDATKSVKPIEKAILSHKIWIDGQPAEASRDQLERLTVVAGEVNLYVSDISWEDGDGKTRYQRIPLGH